MAAAAKSQGSKAANPYAEWLAADDLPGLVKSFYGLKVLMFDAATAEAFLAMNTGNRRVNRRKVQQLAAQMRVGEFENTGEPVIVSQEGVINDGQHRLLAVIEADAVVEMDVRFGIPRKAFTKTDTGASRSSGDVLTIKGVGAGAQVSSTVRLLVLYRRGLPESIREFVSNDEVARAFEEFSGVEDIVAAVNAHSFPKPIRSTPLYATAYLASKTPQKAKLDAWLDAVATGLDVGRTDPAYVLRERLLRGIDAAIGTREGQLERFALMLRSWMLWAKGDTITLRDFRWTSTGRNAEPFPKIANAKI